MNTEAPKGRQDRLIGRQLAGKYRIIQKIGEGGMGSVYIATDETLDRKVAIKVLLGKLAEDEIAVKRFEQEAKAISKMQHPNTVTIYEFGEIPASDVDERRLYIAMEYLRGRTLTQLLRTEGVLLPMRASRIMRQVCASLGDAHAAGIIHRDLKPDNIFLTEVGSDRDWVKVLDFGVAKLANAESAGTLTQTGMIFGTPKYMSPEQAEGRPIDYRADIYALGVVLYELLVGRPPFLSETPVGLLLKHISEPPPSFKRLRPDLDIPPMIEAITQKALAKQPQERHQMVSELAADLEHFERGQSGTFEIPLAGPSGLPHFGGPGLPTEIVPGAPSQQAATPMPPSAVPSSLSLGSVVPQRVAASRGSTTLPEEVLATAAGEPIGMATRATTPLNLADAESLGGASLTGSPRERSTTALFVGGIAAFVAALGLAFFAYQSRIRRVDVVASDAIDGPPTLQYQHNVQNAELGTGQAPGREGAGSAGAASSGENLRADEREKSESPTAAASTKDDIASPTAARTRDASSRSRAPTSSGQDRAEVPTAPRVRFSFSSRPEGAVVMLEGQEIGRTPFMREFPKESGALTLIVRKEGYQEKVITRSTMKDQDVDISLSRRPEPTSPSEGPVTERPNSGDRACPGGPPCEGRPKSGADPLREKVGDLK